LQQRTTLDENTLRLQGQLARVIRR
jgi:hypothetical protein